MFRKNVEKRKKKVSESKEKCIRECSGAYECHAATAENRSSLPKVQGKGETNKMKKG